MDTGGLITMTTSPGDHHGNLTARGVCARSSCQRGYPFVLDIGVAERDSRADGAAHGVLLTGAEANRLVRDLAGLLGLVVMSQAGFMPTNPG
jgi:hypothetical protein